MLSQLSDRHLARYPVFALAVIALALATISSSPSFADRGHNLTAGRPGHASNIDRTIDIDASDIEFDVQQIQVEDGETIRFVVRNSGQLVHDFTIGTAQLQAEHRQEMLRMMQQGTMPSQMEHSDPNAITIPPGETREIIWQFAEAENVEFGCNIPGHYEAGMKGEIEIEDSPS